MTGPVVCRPKPVPELQAWLVTETNYRQVMTALIPADPYPAVLAVPGGLPPEELHLTLECPAATKSNHRR